MNRTIRLTAATAVVLLCSALVSVTGPAQAQGSGRTSAFATGTVFHADLLRSAETRLVDTEVAFSGAVFDSAALDGTFRNELGREFAPSVAGKRAFARGTGLEIGLGVAPDTENQVIVSGRAEASSPPNVGAVSKEVGPVDLDPIAWADLLRGEAFARTVTPCALGADTSRGLAYVVDAQLLDTASEGDAEGLEAPLAALNASDPARAVSQSRSRTVFVEQRDRAGRRLGSNFGIMSEVRETIAPVTLFAGTANEFTIEFLGEWVLQAVATGASGGAWVHYGPGEVSPETPVLRLIDAEGTENLLTLQQVLGDDGLVIDVPGVAEVAIGEPPRAIGGPAGSNPTTSADGTRAAAAVDVVRVRVLPGAPAEVADLRVGHMEVSAQVPAGGINCAELNQPDATPAPETKVLSASSPPLPRTGATAIATLVAGLLLAAASGAGLVWSRWLR